jgi:hypothetical protein
VAFPQAPDVVGAPVGDLHPAPGTVGAEEDEQIDGAVAAIFAVVALKLARLGGNGLAHLADELGRALVEADYRSLGIGRPRHDGRDPTSR